MPGGARGGRAVGDGARVRRAASAVRADAGSRRSGCRCRSGMRCGPCSAWPRGRRRTGSWSALAVLSLLSEVAGERPLVCVIDDEQWLDHASAQALGFVGAAAGAPSRSGWCSRSANRARNWPGCRSWTSQGCADDDARALLDSALAGPLDARVRDQIVAETGGNPLALLELPRGLSPAELAGGFGLPGAGAADGPDRGQLPAAAGCPAGPDPAAAAAGGGRSVR